ncbi:exodeoxyribonuclease VII large subunit [Helicobacter pylori Shi417]|nr:exodeoxyribonuclease VII large subunit [Helicobacter pylori Shi417]
MFGWFKPRDEKNSSHISWEALRKRWGMMFIVAVFRAFHLSLKRMIVMCKKPFLKAMDTICLKEGQEVVVFGGISAYVPRGDYQINCFEIEPKDIGSLTLALEQLKEKLRLNTKNAFDAIVVARGGGSMKDLYSFNDEKIADALHLAKTFSMSAIGHESDFLLSDLVADLRASTPF